MEKVMRLLNKLFFGLIAIVLFSCGEDSALKEETIYFQDKNKCWITKETTGYNFIMIDNNGISQSFTMNIDDYEFNKSWSSFLGVNTEMTHTEYHYQSYTSNYGTQFSLSLTAGFEPFGDDIYIDLSGIGFAYDFKFETISRIYTDFGYKTKSMTDTGYELQDEDIFSIVEILDNYSTNYYEYETVLQFRLKDFNDKWDNFTVTEIYIAKNIGLIKYVLNNGIIYERK